VCGTATAGTVRVLVLYSTQNVPQNIVVSGTTAKSPYHTVLRDEDPLGRKDQGFPHMVKIESAECVGYH